MKIITISREFGSGGRELGKRLADMLGWDYYDKEIFYAVARNRGTDEHYVESTLSNHGWRNQPISFRSTLRSPAYGESSKTGGLLQEQRKVIEEIALLGKNCVIVGRNADLILKDYHPFNIFVYADMQTRLTRCRERAEEGEELTDKDLIRNIKQVDKIRAQSRKLMSASDWGTPASYHLMVNTSDWEIKDLAPALAAFAEQWFSGNQ